MKKSIDKRLMIIGATWEQVPLIMQAKEMGYYVLATSQCEDDDGLKYADETSVVDPKDLHSLLAIAKQFNPDGITADECDYSHYAAVLISNILGLNNDGMEGAQLTSNKLWMRNACHLNNILQPRFMGCTTVKDVRQAINVIGLPVVIKPVDSRGASGVSIISSEDQINKAYFDSLTESSSRQVIIEAFIEGIHITVDGCVDHNGVHQNLAIASKKTIGGSNPVIVEVNYPAYIDDTYKDHIYEVNTKVIDALKISSGLTHSEYILDKKGRCFLVETANRGGGVYTSAKIVPTISGVNLSKLLIDNSVGKDYIVGRKDFSGVVMLKFFVFKSGRIAHVRNVEKAAEIEGVEHIRLLIKRGDFIEKPTSGGKRHGFVILKSDDEDSMINLYNKVLETIEIVYEED